MCPDGGMEKRGGKKDRRKGGHPNLPRSTLLNPKNMFEGVISGRGYWLFGDELPTGSFPRLRGVDQPVGFSSAKAASLTLYDLIEKYKPKNLNR